MIRKLEHFGIKVSDLERSLDFYTKVLGLREVGREKLNDRIELAFLALDGSEDVQLELIGGAFGSVTTEESVLSHIAFTVSDIAAELARLKSLGVKLKDEQPRTILGGVQIAFFEGPDGESLELFQPK